MSIDFIKYFFIFILTSQFFTRSTHSISPHTPPHHPRTISELPVPPSHKLYHSHIYSILPTPKQFVNLSRKFITTPHLSASSPHFSPNFSFILEQSHLPYSLHIQSQHFPRALLNKGKSSQNRHPHHYHLLNPVPHNNPQKKSRPFNRLTDS
nr:MAG TPA: hypothetical protein [Caudoviricetes sp.]